MILPLLITGCRQDSTREKLVGNWVYQSATSPNITAGEEYFADGRYRAWTAGLKDNFETIGTYTMEGRNVTVTRTRDVRASGRVRDYSDVFQFSILKITEEKLLIMDRNNRREVFEYKRSKEAAPQLWPQQEAD